MWQDTIQNGVWFAMNLVLQLITTSTWMAATKLPTTHIWHTRSAGTCTCHFYNDIDVLLVNATPPPIPLLLMN